MIYTNTDYIPIDSKEQRKKDEEQGKLSIKAMCDLIMSDCDVSF